MFDESIKTFFNVVKYGSFLKTAEEMHLAPNAIKKRINRLEEQTGLTLFIRSNKGVKLTEAGESFFEDLTNIYAQYNQSVEKARRIQRDGKHMISVGMTTTFSDTFTISSWHDVRKKLKNTPIHIVYYGNTLTDCEDLLSDTGRKIDVCIDVYDDTVAKKYGLQAKQISEFFLYLGIPDDRDDSKSEPISFSEIEGKKVAILEYGRAAIFDRIHDTVAKEYPNIELEDIHEYSIRTFNDNYIKRNCILVSESQIELYPFYTFFPLAYHEKISFGIYYKETASKEVREFVDTIVKSGNQTVAPNDKHP